MMERFRWLVVALLLGIAPAAWAEEKKESPIGRKIDSLQLQDFRGKAWSLADWKESPVLVVAFLGVECPLARQYGARLQELSEKFAEKKVQFLAVNSNQQDSLAEIAHFAKEFKIEFPVLKDPGNRLADRFSAERTPEVFVLDQDRAIRYWGRIDDQYTYGRQKPQATREHLQEAIQELVAGKPVSQPHVESVGCHIGRVLEPKTNSEVTYTRHIAPILQARCASCHRPGEIGPFALQTYADAVGWAEMIDEVVQENRMPPWHANEKHGKFSNDIRLSKEEKSLISRWVEAGAPEGDPKDLPAPRTFTEGWQIGKPDQVFHIRETPYSVPAKGEVKYQYFMVDTGFTEDKWIKAAECRPGNRAVVHHIIVSMVSATGIQERMAGEPKSEWLTAYAPGSYPLLLAPGQAKRIPRGSKLVFQMHYTPNGTAQTDRSSVGFIYASPEEVKQEVVTQKAATRNFEIPPGDGNYRVAASHRVGRNESMLALFPHMHLRGKAFRYTAVYPDGREEVLLDIPHYDFNWQGAYVLAEPKKLTPGTEIRCLAVFDNSENNLANPDPTKSVRWGDQTWEEMMIGYFDVAIDRGAKNAGGQSGERTAQFLRDHKDDGAEPSSALQRTARRSLESQLNMITFGLQLKSWGPQLDRACLTVIDGSDLRVERVVQTAEVARSVGTEGVKVKADGKAITTIAGQKKPVVIEDLGARREGDLTHMAQAFGSSLHIPITWQGKPATVNFWSAEGKAFPPEAVKQLEQIARWMEEGSVK